MHFAYFWDWEPRKSSNICKLHILLRRPYIHSRTQCPLVIWLVVGSGKPWNFSEFHWLMKSTMTDRIWLVHEINKDSNLQGERKEWQRRLYFHTMVPGMVFRFWIIKLWKWEWLCRHKLIWIGKGRSNNIYILTAAVTYHRRRRNRSYSLWVFKGIFL